MTSSIGSGPLAGRVALVTGCGSGDGLGFAIAHALAVHGAALAITSTTVRIHERVDELSAQGFNVIGVVADLTSGEQVSRLLQAVLDRFGVVDVLVNNAGMVQVGFEMPSAPF